MILPTKHERLDRNVMVLGAEIIKLLKDGSVEIDEAYHYLKARKKELTIDKFHDVLTFLWVLGLIDSADDTISLIKPVPALVP